MQTIAIEVEDSFLKDFLSIIKKYEDKIRIKEDENLQYDSFFYQRQQQLQNDFKEIDEKKTPLLSQDEYQKEINDFFQALETKYAN
jgi:hypothetical protein